jgi:hypothetical protein
MRNSRKKGATLSLVAALVLVIIAIGVFCFFMAKLLGGARELQNACDAGNLNVARANLRSPDCVIFANANSGPVDLSGVALAEAQQNFAPQVDPTNGEIDLLTFDKCVGQTMLVAMNAAADPTPQDQQNAKTLIDLVYNPNTGIGTILANKLKSDPAVDNNFLSLAAALPMRMLDNNNHSSTISVDKDVSYMVRQAPSNSTNLLITSTFQNEIPANYLALDPNFVAENTVKSSDGNTWLQGYSFINIATITDQTSYPIMGVAMRPGDKAHLVSQMTFDQLQASPLPGNQQQPAASRIPPNSFKSVAWSPDTHSLKGLQTPSCSIVGTYFTSLQTALTNKVVSPPSIPCGFLVIANGPDPGNNTVQVAAGSQGIGANVGTHQGTDIFGDQLMGGVYIDPNTNPPAMSQNGGAIPAIEQYRSTNPTGPVPSNLANMLDGPSQDYKQTEANMIGAGDGQPILCDDQNSIASDPTPNQSCINAVPTMITVYDSNGLTGPSGSYQQGLMAIEGEKANVMWPRPYGGPGIGISACTGMKAFPVDGDITDPILFGNQQSTLTDLINAFSAHGSAPVLNQVTTKLYQMNPDTAKVNQALLTQIPMGSVMVIWVDLNGNFQATNIANPTNLSQLPPWINPSNIITDGSSQTITVTANVNATDGNGFVDFAGEEGYPHPWDCAPEPQTNANMQWRRSSGFNCIQGVLRFWDCVNDGGGTWTCPC